MSNNRIKAAVAAAEQTRKSLERLRDAAALSNLAMQELAMAWDEDLKESLDDAARCLIRRASGPGAMPR